MTPDESVRNIDTIEEFTIFGLDRSQQGLDMLLDETGICSAALSENVTPEAFGRLSSLINALHDFDLFENDLCSLFNLDRGRFGDSIGDLKSNSELFRKTLNEIGAKIEANDMDSLSSLLVNELSGSLTRFKELLPQVRNYIDKEYIQANS